MRFSRKIAPEFKPRQSFITKKRLREDEIDFDKLRSYRLDRVRKELEKNNLEACILFDPVNVRYALDTLNMSVCLLYTSPSPRDATLSRMPSSA